MTQSKARPASLPIVGLLCLLLLVAYCCLTTGGQGLTCHRPTSGEVRCEAVSTFFYGLIPGAAKPFVVESVEVVSELTDRVPRGGVRFRHTLTLSGESQTFSTQIAQSPISGAAIKRQVQEFLAGSGPDTLTFQPAQPTFALVRSGLMAFLLGVVSWSFWDVRWPPAVPATSLHRHPESLSQE
ncbi:MAG: hypothetical protein ICV77_06700 [Cyanobacteria bacterium Co-bin8]|nr:hypothetical protein [Cyanobacteria bacterium Co-bin8]